MKYCRCGCGTQIDLSRNYVSGHNLKEKDRKRKNRVTMICETCGGFYDVKESHSWKRKHCSEKCYYLDPTNILNNAKGKKLEEIYGKDKAREIKNKKRISNSKAAKKLWKNPDYVKKQMRALNVQPNWKEFLLNSILQWYFPNEYIYVGDGRLIVHGKSPDFINVNGKKKLIELFGKYWHDEADEKPRKEIFFRYGFDTLIVWAKELNNIETLVNKIEKFTG